MNKRLPKGWFWSYIFHPSKVLKKTFWSACAVFDTGKNADVMGGQAPVFKEVYAIGKTENETKQKVIKLIKKGKWRERPIRNIYE